MSLRNANRAKNARLEHRRLFYKTIDKAVKCSLFAGNTELVSFASFGVLGFQYSRDYQSAYSSACNSYGSHVGSARIFFQDRLTHDLEDLLAHQYASDSAVLFPSATIAHFSILPTLHQLGYRFVIHNKAHMSIRNAIKFSQIPRSNIQIVEGGIEQLKLAARSFGASVRWMYLCDSVYGIDGAFEPLNDVIKIANTMNGCVYIDDSHATGVHGRGGIGLGHVALKSCPDSVLVGSFSKALGAYGAFAILPDKVNEMIRWGSSVSLFTGPLPPGCAAQCSAALKMSHSVRGDSARLRLRKNVEFLSKCMNVPDRKSHIFFVRTKVAPLDACARLLENGFIVNPILFPAVARGSEGIRIVVSTSHSRTQMLNFSKEIADLKIEFVDN